MARKIGPLTERGAKSVNTGATKTARAGGFKGLQNLVGGGNEGRTKRADKRNSNRNANKFAMLSNETAKPGKRGGVGGSMH